MDISQFLSSTPVFPSLIENRGNLMRNSCRYRSKDDINIVDTPKKLLSCRTHSCYESYSDVNFQTQALKSEVLKGNQIKTLHKHHNRDVLNYTTKPAYYQCPILVETLSKTVSTILVRHGPLFESMFYKIFSNHPSTGQQIVEEYVQTAFFAIVDEMFNDGQVNWGRIIVLHAFAYALAQRLSRINSLTFTNFITSDDITELDFDATKLRIVRQCLSQSLVNLGHWIDDNGGWDGFVNQYAEQPTVENKVWKGLLWTAVGLGTLMAIVAVR